MTRLDDAQIVTHGRSARDSEDDDGSDYIRLVNFSRMRWRHGGVLRKLLQILGLGNQLGKI